VNFFFLEIDHIGYKKIKNFMLISKMQTYLSDKMPPKKVKIKKRKKWDLASLENSFLLLTFFGGILSLRQVCFF
jgi:hypothetical protein